MIHKKRVFTLRSLQQLPQQHSLAPVMRFEVAHISKARDEK